MNDWTENLHGRPLIHMKPGETLYAQRNIQGFSRHFFGALVSVVRGTVTIRGRWTDRYGSRLQITSEERFRVDRCFLYGKPGGKGYARCHWFKRGKAMPAD